MRLKFDRNDPNEYRCCFCLHVRTGTVLLGIWHLLMHILLVSVFGVVMLHPELIQKLQTPEVDVSNQSQITDTTKYKMLDQDIVEDPYSYDTWFTKKSLALSSEDKFVAMLVTFCSFMITCMLVYGSLRGKPGYLMPFFCLQVFDFCIACLTIVSFFSYTSDVKTWIAKQEYLPFREQLLHMKGDWLMLLAVFSFVLVMTVKAYLIGIVWACYKYLTNKSLNLVVRRGYSTEEAVCDDAEMLLPPKYEDVVDLPPEQPIRLPGEQAPPPYSSN